ncbi:MAG: 50S ribosomal protein L6 [Patescibacteria group bacterium]
MSRLAKKPIEIPNGVTVTVADGEVRVKGPKGELSMPENHRVAMAVTDKDITLTIADEKDKEQRAHWGLIASLVKNMMVGVTEGYEKKLEINGVGFKAQMKGKDLELNVGFSHPVTYKIVEGVKVEVDKNVISVSGIDKQLVGQVAAEIRAVKKPEPYKGKGIKYIDEVIRRKAGKVGKAAA